MKHFILAVLCAACSPYSISGGVKAPIAPFGPVRTDVATICVMRSTGTAKLVTFVVHDNQTLVGATKGDSYFCYEAEPGPHVIVSDTFDSVDHPGKTMLTAVPGARYWLRQDHVNSWGAVTSVLEWVDETTAASMFDGAEYRVLTDVPGHEHVPQPVPFAVASYDKRSR